MENLVNQFMHIYFWVFLITSSIGILNLILNSERYKDIVEKPKVSFWGIVSIVIL